VKELPGKGSLLVLGLCLPLAFGDHLEAVVDMLT